MADEKKDQELSPLEQAFVDAYFEESFNATEAAIRVYGPYNDRQSARSAGWRLLQKQKIKDAVEIQLRAWRASRRMSVQEFGDQLADAAKVEMGDFFHEDGSLKPFSEMSLPARRQIAAIEWEYQRVWEPMLGDYVSIKVPKIKLWDRRRAEELWGKWQKMFTEKVEVAGEGGGPVKVAFSLNGIAK